MRIAAAVCATLLISGSGCGKPVLRLADASLGDYYTDKELKKLSDEQREEYCRELENQREIYVAQVADADEALDAIQLGAGARRTETDSLKARAARLEARLAEARARAGTASADNRPGRTTAPAKTPSDTYVVKPGDSLWRISGLAETLGRPTEWTRLYHANRDRIKDPDRIYPGEEIQIPR